MCYLIAKDREAQGCFALKTSHGKHLVELKRELNNAVGYKVSDEYDYVHDLQGTSN